MRTADSASESQFRGRGQIRARTRLRILRSNARAQECRCGAVSQAITDQTITTGTEEAVSKKLRRVIGSLIDREEKKTDSIVSVSSVFSSFSTFTLVLCVLILLVVARISGDQSTGSPHKRRRNGQVVIRLTENLSSTLAIRFFSKDVLPPVTP